jgi:hypothetical protein
MEPMAGGDRHRNGGTGLRTRVPGLARRPRWIRAWQAGDPPCVPGRFLRSSSPHIRTQKTQEVKDEVKDDDTLHIGY